MAEKKTKWGCKKNNQHIGDVDIWWGHTEGDGGWACNNWISACGGSCVGYDKYNNNPKKIEPAQTQKEQKNVNNKKESTMTPFYLLGSVLLSSSCTSCLFLILILILKSKKE